MTFGSTGPKIPKENFPYLDFWSEIQNLQFVLSVCTPRAMHQQESLLQLLLSNQQVVIFPHRKPDADALGSALALSAYLRKLGNQTTVISPTDYPRFLEWMPGNHEVLNYEAQTEQATKAVAQATLFFCVDFSAISRIDDLGKIVKENGSPIALIDHHLGKEDFAAFELWDPKAAATAELVFDFIHLNGHAHLIDDQIAQCLYAGIMTDTGSFKYPSTSGKIHRIIAELKDNGLDSSRLHRLIYDTNTEDRLRFLGYALSEKLTVLPALQTAYFAITAQEQQRFRNQTGDTEGLVNYGLSIEGVAIAALFVEKKDHVKMSFRSVGDFNVAELANRYFGGGGHKNAAGGILYASLEQTVELFLSVLPAFYNEAKTASS